MTHDQLNRLIARAKQRKAQLEPERIAKVREKVQKLIESQGLALEDVLVDFHSKLSQFS